MEFSRKYFLQLCSEHFNSNHYTEFTDFSSILNYVRKPIEDYIRQLVYACGQEVNDPNNPDIKFILDTRDIAEECWFSNGTGTDRTETFHINCIYIDDDYRIRFSTRSVSNVLDYSPDERKRLTFEFEHSANYDQLLFNIVFALNTKDFQG